MAIPVDAETRTALQAPVKQLRSTITWTGTDMQPHTMTSEDRIISIKKEAEGYYFASALRKITITTSGTGTELMDQDVAITIQVKKADQTWGNLPWGTFRIEETTISEDKGTTTYVGYGGVYKLQQREYIGGELNFPTTVGGLITQVAEATGLIVNGGEEILPAEYQSIEYLEGTGTQYIVTDFKPSTKTKLEIELEPGTIPVDPNYNETGIAGEWQSEKTYRVFWSNYSTFVYYFNCAGIGSFSINVPLQKHTLIFDPQNGKAIVNGIERTFTPPSVPFQSTNNMKIYRADVASNYYCGQMKLYSFKVYEDGTLAANYHPAIRRSDNKPGLYDTVSGVFYTNAGTDEFITGPETHWLPNADAPITEDLYARITGTTYRDILEELAGATGTLAVIGGGDDTLDFNQPPIGAPTDTMTEENLIKFKIGENWGKCSAVVLSRQPQGDNIEVYDQNTAQLPAGNNLTPYPYSDGASKTNHGIEFSVNNDGTIELTGQNDGTGNSTFFLISNPEDHYILPPGTYKIITPASNSIGFVIYDGSTYYDFENVNNYTRTFSSPIDVRLFYVQVRKYNTTQFSNTKAYPMLNTKNITTAAGYESFIPNGRVDLVVTNNEILDDQRETTATPILNAVKGWEYREATLKTEGHGYHEIGDRIDVTIGGQTFPTIITKSVIIVDGGINETLTSTTPTKTSIDYSKTGGITKTIYNTELAVDRQGQEIVGIVSRQDQQDETIAENYTRIIQNINSIVQTVQVSGGGNLIKNSVGFGKNSDGTLTIWQYGAGADTTTVRSQSSTASLNAGGISGHEIDVNGATISQTVQLTAGELYNLSCRVQKQATGTATITIDDSVQTITLTAQASTAYEWNQLNADFTPQTGSVTITITTTEGWTSITDLMLAQGGITGWRQASGEIYNLQVSVDQDGVQVKSATYAGDYVQITPLEFAGYSNAGGAMKKVFTVNRDTTEVAKLQAESMIKMPPMEIVPIDNANFKGWAIVKAAE